MAPNSIRITPVVGQTAELRSPLIRVNRAMSSSPTVRDCIKEWVEVDKKGCVIVYRGPNEPVRFGEILVVAVAPDVEGELFTFCDICFAVLDGQHL